MSTSDARQRIHIDIPPNEVNLTLDDIFGPMLQKTTGGPQAQPGTATNPELAQHLQTLSGLIAQLTDVVDNINRIDPTILGSKPVPDVSA